MGLIVDNWNIVISGAWNVSIFNVRWLAEHVFSTPEVKASIPLIPGFPVKFTSGGLEVIASEERLMLRTDKADDDGLIRMESTAIRILELLLHTPVRAAGINFDFRVSQPGGDLLGVFLLSDAAHLGASRLDPVASVVRRSFQTDVGLLNIILEQADKNVVVRFNYHREAAKTQDAVEHIKDRVVQLKNRALEIARTVYSLETE